MARSTASAATATYDPANPQASLERVFQVRANLVYNTIRQRVADRQTAEDLTGEVFCRLWAARDKLPQHDAAALAAWMLTVARNLVIDHHRRLGRASNTRLELKEPPPECGDPFDFVVAAESADRVHAVLSKLKPGQREIFRLCVLEGWSATAVAAALGKNPATVRSTLSRAKQVAQRAYRDLFGEYLYDVRPGGGHAAQ